MTNYKKIVFLLFLSFISAGQTWANTKGEEGLPLITTYGIKDHGGLFQNWAFIQDMRGVMYVGNGVGLLEFDGANWRIIKTTNNSFVRSLGIDKDGTVFVGGSAEFGYLASDENLQKKYKSLLEYVKKEDQIFSYVWTTKPTPGGIYFQTRERIFRFNRIDKGSSSAEWDVKVWKPESTFDYAFWINNSYYVKQGNGGILKMIDDSLHLLPGSEQFSSDRLQVILPFGTPDKGGVADTLLVGTFNRGLFLYYDNKFVPYQTSADNFLNSGTLYDGTILSDGNYALATLDGGLVTIDKKGKIIHILDKTTGIPDNSISAVYVDREGKLWAGPDNGICIIETPSPLTRYSPASGLIAAANRIVRHKGTLYIASQDGIFFIDPKTSIIKPVTGYGAGTTQTFHLLSIGDELLAAVNIGLYKIEGDKAIVIKKSSGLTFSPQFLHKSLVDSNRIFLGVFDGLVSFKKSAGNGNWIYEGEIEGISTYISGIIESEPGVLWLGSYDNGSFRVQFKDNSLENPQIDHYDSFDGTSKIGGVQVYDVASHPVFITKDGIFIFNKELGKFEKDPMFEELSTANFTPDQLAIAEDKNGDIWFMVDRNRVILRKQKDGSYLIDNTVLERFADELINDIYIEDNGIIWITVNDGIVRYDTNFKLNYEQVYPALIRKITAGEDNLIYGGAEYTDSKIKELSFDNNALRFDFSATSYTNPKETVFQSFLEGFDNSWSAWTAELSRVYTNLPHGEYVFHVRAKNVYAQPSSEAEYKFEIYPPWYYTWWAYGFYVLLLGLVVFLVDRIQRRKLISKERERSRLREAELRAGEAEAKSKVVEAQAHALKAENEQKKNVELLSEIGKTITASLSVKNIMKTVYNNVNDLMDATVFGIGLFDPEKGKIDFPWTIEKGETLPPFSYSHEDVNRPAVLCYKDQKEIVMNDYEKEFPEYFGEIKNPVAGDNPESMIYLPLTFQDKKIGVITAQSFSKNSYTDYHLNILRNLATYAAIALDNANTYRQLNATIDELNKTLKNLKTTQEQLLVQEKLASLGQLTAGIAHEIKNPLNFVNNFAELSGNFVSSVSENIRAQKSKFDEPIYAEIEDDLNKLAQLNAKINEHGKRADSIVKSMMAHARSGKGERIPTDINVLLDESVNLVYHGLRARQTGFNITIEKKYDESAGKIDIVSQDISRVFLNIIGNACYAAYDEHKTTGGSPLLILTTRKLENKLEIKIRDNGSGISKEMQEKIFTPFFTTKPAGEGTGLGLSISYDIVVKGHEGELRVESEPGEYTEFIISLPIS